MWIDGTDEQMSPLLLSIDGTDRRTDSRRYVNPVPHTIIIIMIYYASL